jgi:hypothetical protein
MFTKMPAQFGAPPNKPTGPWMNKSLSPDQRAHLLIAGLIFNADKHAWELVPGDYMVQAGGSSRDLPLPGSIHLD